MLRIQTLFPLGVAAAVAGSLILTDGATADSPSPDAPALFEVTITNLTSNQVFSAPIVTSHSDATRLFEPGTTATPELQAMAEDGDNSGLATLMGGDSEVLDVATFAANIAPGTSASTTISLDAYHDSLSVAGMLVTTNDAFFGLDAVSDMRHSDGRVFFAPVFDAGTEYNSEDCMYIPGPPCGNGGSHDPRADVGFIHFSNGIHGVGSLDAPTYDWGPYAARIEVRRL